MKKFRILIGALALAVVAAAFIGCKKEKEAVLMIDDQTEINNPQNDAEVKRILNFKKQVETRKSNPGMKSAETVTLEEAMNNIVDLFNVTYTEPMAYYTESERHEFTLNVALTADGKVLLDDVVAAYEQALANAREAYHGSNLPDKAYQRLMVTCTPQRDGTVDLMFDGKYGTKTDQPEPPAPHIDGPFSVGDDWHYRNGMGRCCDTCSSISGADKVLQVTIMNEVLANRPVDPDGYRGFYTHFRKKVFCASENKGVFYRTDVDNTCIEWVEMNDYLVGEKNIIYHVLPQMDQPVINLNGNLMQGYRDYVYEVEIDGKGGVDEGHIRHDTEVVYARYNFIENGIIAPADL
jgi:hypothetical protein